MNTTTPTNTPDDFDALVTAYLDGRIEPEAFANLRETMRRDPAMLDRFVELTMLDRSVRETLAHGRKVESVHDARLRSESTGESFEDLLNLLSAGADQARPVTFETHAHRKHAAQDDAGMISAHDLKAVGGYLLRHYPVKKYATIGAVAAVLLLAAAFLALYIGSPDEPGTPGSDFVTAPSTPVVAHVHSSLDAQWVGLAHGEDRLHADTSLTLTRGLAHIELSSGARVIVQAPAVFELTGTNAMRLKSGKLVANVPPDATGFAVSTSSARLVDLGTEFGVFVYDDGTTEAHVFQGRVEAFGTTPGVSRLLRGSEAVTISADGGSVVPRPAEPIAFIRAREYEQHIQGRAQQSALMSDPSVIAYYGFDRPGVEVLRESRGRELFDARIVGARWVEGRTAGKRALKFDGQAGDEHVTLSPAASGRLALDGAYTIAMWVNISDLPVRDGWTSIVTKGNDSWRILINEHGNEQSKRRIGFYQSTSVAAPSQVWDGVVTGDFEIGRWHHLVVTGEPNGDTVVTRLYLDGELKDEDEMPRMLASAWPVALGANAQRPEDFQFNGLLDEIAFFSRALPEAELRRLYHAGARLDSDKPDSDEQESDE